MLKQHDGDVAKNLYLKASASRLDFVLKQWDFAHLFMPLSLENTFPVEVDYTCRVHGINSMVILLLVVLSGY